MINKAGYTATPVGVGPHCSCPNSLVTLNTAPAHSHATGVAVYPSLFVPFMMLELTSVQLYKSLSPSIHVSVGRAPVAMCVEGRGVGAPAHQSVGCLQKIRVFKMLFI